MTENELQKIINEKPLDGSPEELEQWRQRVAAAKEELTKEHLTYMRRMEEQWKPGEWEDLRSKLERLSLQQLRDIADRVSIRFAIGNEKIMDKEEFLDVLDEAEKNELYAAYKDIAETGS